jgi:amino acid adenylation domain-containing protein
MKMHNVEDIYPLSPMQQGLLFHTCSAPDAALYFEQWTCVLQGNLDVPAFRRAWQHIVERHPPLRTFFLWEGLDEPLQVVRQQVQIPWEQQDWRGRPAPEQQDWLDALLQDDQARGFDLTRAPLMRLLLIRISHDTYRFIWSFHHMLLDGWSISLIFKEVVACYTAFCQGQDPQLESRRPYWEYISWLKQQDLAAAEVFWRHTLKGFVAPSPLVGDRPRRAGPDQHSYASHQIALPAVSTAALRCLARAHQLTLSTLVQGAWALLLSRYSGEEDVVFGVVVSGRPTTLPGAEAMIGLLVNTLPARVRVLPGAELLPWLQAFQDRQVEARQYEYSPLVQLQQWSEMHGKQPLFESLVTFENYPAGGFALQSATGNVAVRDAQIIERTNYALTISAIPADELALKFMYDTERFEAAAIYRLAEQFQTVLKGIAGDPRQRLADLALLTLAERRRLLVEWNATEKAYPSDLFLHTAIEAQAERTPNAVAVVFEGAWLSYAELNQRANQLAHHLRKLGVGPDTLVGISLERSVELVVGLLGILKAGGAYVPLDPSYPAERLQYMLADSRVAVVLTATAEDRGLKIEDSSLAGTTSLSSILYPLSSIQVVDLVADWPLIAQQPTEIPDVVVTPDNLAYMIYTSGSTGKPKGAMNTHGGICNRLLWMQDAYQLTPSDRVLQKTPFSFDVSVWEFFWPLMTGAGLVVARPGGHQDSAYLARLIVEQQITTVHFVPSMLQIFLDEPGLERCASLRRVICSGEALPFDLQERFFARLGAELHNLYGPTEAAVDVTFWNCKGASEPPMVPIGRPIANTQMHILDARFQPVPIGVAGELYIGGIGLARGYLGRPELTAERFIPNPFTDFRFGIFDFGLAATDTAIQNRKSKIQNGERLYRTGDLARYREDGNIEYLGRIDHQVKIRGFRIELGEIEAALRQHPAVADAVAVVREDTLGDKRLVGYIVPRLEDGGWKIEDGPLGATSQPSSILHPPSSILSELRSFLKQWLPEYMIPSAFMAIQAVPLSPNGKADRRALPAPESPRPQLEATYAAPQTEIERAIASIWKEVLHVDAVGLHDNFFDIGGHSLHMAQVHSKLREISAGEMSIVDLFQYPTVSALARYLSRPPATPRNDESDGKLRERRGRLRQQLRQRERA